MKKHRPYAIRNVDDRLNGLESIRLYQSDWHDIREYIDHLETWIVLKQSTQEKGDAFKSFDDYMMDIIR